MKPFYFYRHSEVNNKIHPFGLPQNEDHRRAMQLRTAAAVFHASIPKALKETHHWFTESVYKNVAPQHGAFDRLVEAISATTGYHLVAIQSTDRMDYDQFGMVFRCKRNAGEADATEVMIRAGLFKDITTIRTPYADAFPLVQKPVLKPEDPGHLFSRFKELMDVLQAKPVQALINDEAYCETPEGYVYMLTEVRPEDIGEAG